MFCARCGQQIPEASVTCPLCGREATIQLPPQPTSFSNAPALVFDPVVGSRQQVGGWLLFFCITTAILTPLFNLGSLLRLAEIGSPWALYYLVLVGFTAFVGITVWLVRPSAIPLVRAYFITFALWELFRIPYVVMTAAGNSMDLQMVMRIRTLIWVVLWAAYFQKSQRVRATFGRNLSDA